MYEHKLNSLYSFLHYFHEGDLLMADPAISTRTPEKKSRITSTLAKFQLPKALYIVLLPVTIVAPRPTPIIPQLTTIMSCDFAVDKTGTTNIYVFSVFHITLFLSTCIILRYWTSDWKAELKHKKWLHDYKETVFEKSVICNNSIYPSNYFRYSEAGSTCIELTAVW